MTIAAPVVTGIAYSPSGVLQPGTPFTVTVTYTPGTSNGAPLAEQVTATITDANNNLAGTLQGTLQIAQTVTDPCTAAFADTTGRQYAPVSNTVSGGAGTAVFSATA
jgi:hypothetical protein